jgi:hypothetical protein
MPKRVQLRRVKGYRKPEWAVVVARPTVWGNPFRVGDPHPDHGWPMSRQEAVECYRRGICSDGLRVAGGFITDDVVVEALRGLDLACWCRLDQPCHADVLLEVAN